MGTTRLKTVKAPSIKEDFKEEIRKELGHDVLLLRNEFREEDKYLCDRIERLENKNFDQEASRLSISDWFMIGCYIIIAIGCVVVTIRTIQKSKTYGHS